MQRTSTHILGVRAEAPRPTVTGAALVAAAVCLPLLALWGGLMLL